MPSPFPRLALAVCALFAAAPLAGAATVYDSFNAGNTYLTGNGIAVYGANQDPFYPFFDDPGIPQFAAGSFTLSQPTHLTAATFGITGSQLDMALTADAAGLPGSAITSFSLSPSATPGSVTSASLNITLAPGTYWFTAAPHDADSSATWGFSATSLSPLTGANAASSTDGLSWSADTFDKVAFSVDGAVVPTPAAASAGTLLLAGLAASSYLRRSRRPA